MSLIQIEGYDDFLDTDLGVIRNPKGNIIGGVPIGAFAYKGKLYGEGTIVELNYGGKRKAVFEKEPNEQHESWREDYYQFREVKVKDLSTGMKQKVSLVIAIAHDPEIIIFDEPTNGLDVITAKTVTDFLLELKKDGKTILLSTHIFSLVEKLCDRVGIIMDGKMIK